MGLAASQARLLLLTARRSDLEYRAQMISQRKIALAMETEQVAKEYTQALNNRQLMFVYSNSVTKQTSKKEVLSFIGLMTGNNIEGGVYRVITKDGKVAMDNNERASSYPNVKSDGKSIEVISEMSNDQTFQEMLLCGALTIQKLEATGNVIYTNKTDPNDVIYQSDYDKLTEDEKAKYGDGVAEQKWVSKTLNGLSEITEELYTEDDNAAMATYEVKSQQIQGKDKQLDVELKQIETQLEACKSEQESVKKLIQDRAKNDFQLFS